MEQDTDELITIAEAAQRAEMTIPRLRRLLAKPQWKKHIKVVTRETKTGSRPTSVIPVSVLEALLSSGGETGDAANNLVSVAQKTIADKDSEIEYLRAALRIAQESLLREQQAHSETRRMLAPPPDPTPEPQEPTAPKKSWLAKILGG